MIHLLTLADALNMEPEFWLNLQRDLDLWNARQKHKVVAKINVLNLNLEQRT